MDCVITSKSMLRARTQKFAIEVIQLTKTLPKSPEFRIVARQLIRSATSVGANYRAACRAQSRAHFIAKMSIVEEEADESLYWMELTAALGHTVPALKFLQKEAEELLRMIVSSKKTAKTNRKH